MNKDLNNSQIKILHILWSGRKGGAEKNVADIVTGINSKDILFEVLFLADKGYWGDYLKEKNIVTFELKAKHAVQSVFPFIAFLLKRKYDIYHCHTESAFAKIILKLFKKTVVFSVHNNSVLLEKVWSIKRKLTIGFADYYITPSIYIKNHMKQRYRIDSELIYHGIRFEPLDVKKQKVEEKTVYKIGALTHLEKIKGNEILIKAARLLVDRGNKYFKIFIAGDGREENNLKRLINQLELSNYVELLGPITDVNEFLDSLDIYVSTSLGESFGISILEAMARALPIVCTNTPAFLEIVIDNVNGLVSLPAAAEISANLAKLLTDSELRASFGKSSYKLAAEKFSMEKMIEKYKEYYLTCAQKTSV